MKFPNLKGKVLLAPMAGITNVAFRTLCVELGAAAAYTDMVSANAIACADEKLIAKLVDIDKSEKVKILQLFGEDSKNFIDAALKIQKRVDIIDLNFGCPSTNIICQGAGSKILTDSKKIKDIVKGLTDAVSVPVTVKMRLSFDKEKSKAIDNARLIEKCGASALAVHGRTAEQGYSGKSDWSFIKKIKDEVSIPVLGNGDIVDPKSAMAMFEQTGCDYEIVARAAKDNPYFFTQVNHYFKTGELLPNLPYDEKIKLLYRYYDLLDKFKINNFENMRQTAQNFTCGYTGAAKLRFKLNSAKSLDEIKAVLDGFKED